MADRGRDFGDIFTVSAETGLVNANLQILHTNVGLGIQGGYGAGLRSGAMGAYEFADLNLMLVNARVFEPSDFAYSRGKGYEYSIVWNPGEDEFGDPIKYEVLMEEGGSYNLYQLELTACLGVGLRLGINFAEIADFVCGLFLLDPLQDDTQAVLERKAEIRRQRQVLEELQEPMKLDAIFVNPAVDNRDEIRL